MRHKTPLIVSEYYNQVSAIKEIKEPECCHTCDSYTEEGICREYLITPPEDFAQTTNQCELWIPIIPF